METLEILKIILCLLEIRSKYPHSLFKVMCCDADMAVLVPGVGECVRGAAVTEYTDWGHCGDDDGERIQDTVSCHGQAVRERDTGVWWEH